MNTQNKQQGGINEPSTADDKQQATLKDIFGLEQVKEVLTAFMGIPQACSMPRYEQKEPYTNVTQETQPHHGN